MIRAPLSHVKVLDLSRVLAGPWCTQLLADYGATVFKIEKPGQGDDTRSWGPPFVDESRSAYFMCANRNKYSVCVDFSKPEGAELVRSLASAVDVLVENYKVGGLAKYQLDFQSAKKVNPRIVYASITGYGQENSPRVDEPGYDFIIQGMAGLMSTTGPANEHYKTGVAVSDVLTGMYAATGILAALNASPRVAAHVDASLMDSQLAGMANIATSYLYSGNVPRKPGNSHVNISPYSSFRAKDGVLIVCVGNDEQFRKFVQCVLTEDAPYEEEQRILKEFATNKARVIHADDLAVWINEKLQIKTCSQWIAVLNDAGVPCGPINNIGQAFQEEHSQQRRMVSYLRDKDPGKIEESPPRTAAQLATAYPVPSCGVRFTSDSGLGLRAPEDSWAPPKLGAHTRHVLVDLVGVCSHAQFDQLAKSRIVQ
eukprot:ANDGO_03004.mRNA.1 CaiB/baiF CoA-transferase family protein DDB_G0269880